MEIADCGSGMEESTGRDTLFIDDPQSTIPDLSPPQVAGASRASPCQERPAPIWRMSQNVLVRIALNNRWLEEQEFRT